MPWTGLLRQLARDVLAWRARQKEDRQDTGEDSEGSDSDGSIGTGEHDPLDGQQTEDGPKNPKDDNEENLREAR